MGEWIAKYWISFVFGLLATGLTGGFGISWAKLRKRLRVQKVTDDAIKCLSAKVEAQQKICEDQALIKEAMKALLWDRLYQIYNDAEKVGCLSVDALRNVENIYNQYHALGGNGTGTELYQRLCDLPTRKTRLSSLENEEK